MHKSKISSELPKTLWSNRAVTVSAGAITSCTVNAVWLKWCVLNMISSRCCFSPGNLHNRAASFLKGAMQKRFDLNEFSQTCCLTDCDTRRQEVQHVAAQNHKCREKLTSQLEEGMKYTDKCKEKQSKT